MRKFNGLAAGLLLLWLALMAGAALLFQRENPQEQMGYKVELNTWMQGFERAGGFTEPDLREAEYIQAVFFLPCEAAEETASKEALSAFCQNHNGVHAAICPLFSGNTLLGWVRFDYVTGAQSRRLLWLTEGALLLSGFFMLAVLCYVRQGILKPFHVLSEMPYELSKGNLQGDPPESRNRLFGRFVWGVTMLRDTLSDTRNRELKLEKEKKLLLLSISHDVKIPLSAIRLYAKSLQESLWQTEAERRHAAAQIEKHAVEIEQFVQELVHTAGEDILALEVADSEFYLREYIDKIRQFYEPKCRLVLTDFHIGDYENILLKGDIDRAFEVMENLMENALKYGDGREIRITFYEEDGCRIIRVFNSGTPVAAQELPHLFDSFYRGSNVGGQAGNGLGLYINRQLMRKMGGEIFAQREAEGMSLCLVFLPSGAPQSPAG
ncbi:MAG: HAMP domain-containing histidine kinase [Roseburia sp.]|nr:HAMP domain-containing histidine kinase [Roseburia sp.]